MRGAGSQGEDEFAAVVDAFEAGLRSAPDAWSHYLDADPGRPMFDQAATRFHALLIQRRADRELGFGPSQMLELGLAHAEKALAREPARPSDRAVVLSNYSILLLETWFHDDEDDCLLQAIGAIEEALVVGHPDPAMVRIWHVNAAACCSDAGFCFSDDEYFKRSAAHARQVDGPDGDRVVLASRYNLAEALSSRFRLVGDIRFLDEAIQVSERILPYAETSSWPERFLESHASMLAERHRVVGGRTDLAASIEMGKRVLEISPEPDRVARNQSMRLARRFEVEGDPSDLLDAESLARTAAEHVETGAMGVGRVAIWISRVTDLAAQLGNYDAVPAALELGAEQLERSPDHPDSRWLANVMSHLVDETLSTTFQVEGFDRARKLRLADSAVTGLDPRSPRMPDYLSWRAIARLRNRRTFDAAALADPEIVRASIGDAHRAVEIGQTNVAVLGRAHAVLAITAGVRGVALARRQLAESFPDAVTSWLANGLGVDRSDLAIGRLANLGSDVSEAILGQRNPGESEMQQLERAGAAAVMLRAFWLDRLDGIDRGPLEAADPDLARRWDAHVHMNRIAQHREIAGAESSGMRAVTVPSSHESERRALLGKIRGIVSGFGHGESWSRSLLDLSAKRPVGVMVSSPQSLRCFAFVDGNAESVSIPMDWASLRRVLGHALHGPQRLARSRPLEDALSTVIAAIGPAGTEMAALFGGIGPSRPVALLGDGLARSLPWAAAPLGPDRHLGDELLLVSEPAPRFIAVSPSPIPSLVSILDGGDLSLLWAGRERDWLIRNRAATEVLPSRSDSDPPGTEVLLHVMAHGVADRDQPRNSGIAIDDGHGNRRILQAHDLVDAGVVPSIVLLAACSLAQSGTTWKTSALAAPVIDTFRVFGANSVAGYLSPCGDQAASLLSIRVHQEIANGTSTDLASAVRSAQQWAKASGDAEVTTWAEEAFETDFVLERPIRRPSVWGNLTVSGW